MQGWWDVERTLREMDVFRRRVDALTEAFEGGRRDGAVGLGWGGLPEAHWADKGENYTLTAEVPGLSAADIDLQVTAQGVTLSGARQPQAPEGFAAYREERRAWRFSRNFGVPARIDPERVTAEVRDGVLTVVLPKASESMPRRINIQA